MTQQSSRVEGACRRALDGVALSEDELCELLQARGAEAESVYAAARQLRARHWGSTVFLYGFVYFSTYCRNACAFCLYRAGNPEALRYRKSEAEIDAVCRELAHDGVVLVDLTMGEDPEIHAEPGYGQLLRLMAVAGAAGLPVMVSPGVLPDSALHALRNQGAEWYALYQETHDEALYRRLRPGQPADERVRARFSARAAGLLVEDGLLTGIGDTVRSRARSIVAMRQSGCEQVRVMTLVPQRGTPLDESPSVPPEDELLTIAVMRLVMPERLIPASLDVDGIDGLELRLLAGANVVTSLVPPNRGLAGVSQAELGIDEGQRTVASVVPRLEALGLRAGSVEEYRTRLAELRGRRRAAS